MKEIVTVAELSQICKVSDMTVRRDLAELEEEGLINRSYGGATKALKVASESPFDVRSTEASTVKKLIGYAAARMISPGDSVALDVGTTMLEMARFLKQQSGITVVTSSIPVINELADNEKIELIGIGGTVRVRDFSFVGDIAQQALNNFYFDRCFIGVAGISFENGFSAYNLSDCAIKKAMIERSREVVVVSDSSKLDKTMFAQIGPLSMADYLVTDKALETKHKEMLEKEGIQVVIAEEVMETTD